MREVLDSIPNTKKKKKRRSSSCYRFNFHPFRQALPEVPPRSEAQCGGDGHNTLQGGGTTLFRVRIQEEGVEL
jgi:hypothetical protein